MKYYLDTSLLVAACVAEPASERAQDWLLASAGDVLAISPWVETEFAAAIAMKVQLGRYSQAQADQVSIVWRTLRSTQLTKHPIGSEHFSRAADLANRAEPKLRAGDALHLAIAIDFADAIVTLNRDLMSAAGLAGFEATVP